MSAKPARHLALVDRDTGEVVDSRELAELQRDLAEVKTKFKMAQRDVAAKNLRIANLEADHARRRLDHDRYKDACRVAKYWWLRCRAGDARVHYLSPDRIDAVLALMDMKELVAVEGKKRRQWQERYTMADFKMAIDGAHFDHYVSKRKNGTDQHHDDLELICRNVSKFAEFILRCPYPREVAQRALEEDTSTQGSNRRPTQATTARSEGSHDLGVSGFRVAVLAEAGRPYLRARVGARAPGAPASV